MDLSCGCRNGRSKQWTGIYDPEISEISGNGYYFCRIDSDRTDRFDYRLDFPDSDQNRSSMAGKKVALDKSASSYYFFLTALENESSLTEDDINVIDMGDTTEAGLAFMSGSVDAAIMWEPELSEALESVDGAHALVTSADYQDTILDSLVVNSDYAKEKPDVVAAVEDAWYKAVDFLNENPDKAYEEMASGFEEVTAEDVASDVKGLKFFGKDDNEKLNDEGNADSIYAISQKMADFWMEKGECETDDLTDFFELVK